MGLAVHHAALQSAQRAFAERLLVEEVHHALTVILLIVASQMLGTGVHALFLDCGHDMGGRQIIQVGILGKVFKAAAAKGGAVQVAAGTPDFH